MTANGPWLPLGHVGKCWVYFVLTVSFDMTGREIRLETLAWHNYFVAHTALILLNDWMRRQVARPGPEPAHRIRERRRGWQPEAYSQSAPAPTAPEMERKIIQNANLDLEVEDVAQAMDRINAICIENGEHRQQPFIQKRQRFSARLSITFQEKLHDIIALFPS